MKKQEKKVKLSDTKETKRELVPPRHIQSKPDLTKVMRILIVPAGVRRDYLFELGEKVNIKQSWLMSFLGSPQQKSNFLQDSLRQRISEYADEKGSQHYGLYRENALPLRFEPVILPELLADGLLRLRNTDTEAKWTFDDEDYKMLKESFKLRHGKQLNRAHLILAMMNIFDALLTKWQKMNQAGRGQEDGVIHAVLMPGPMPSSTRAVVQTKNYMIDKHIFEMFMERRADAESIQKTIDEGPYQVGNAKDWLPFIFARMVQASRYWWQRGFMYIPWNDVYETEDFDSSQSGHGAYYRVEQDQALDKRAEVRWKDPRSVAALINLHPAITAYKFAQAEDNEGRLVPIRNRETDPNKQGQGDIGEAVTDTVLNANVKKHIQSFLLMGRYSDNPMMLQFARHYNA